MWYVWLFALGPVFLRPIASCYSGFNDTALHLIFPLSESWLVSAFDPWDECSEGGHLRIHGSSYLCSGCLLWTGELLSLTPSLC